VNWNREAVLVVSLGMNMNSPKELDLAGADHKALHTDVALSLVYGQGGMAPSVVVAMDKAMASSVLLPNAAEMGLPAMAQVYVAAPALSNGAAGGTSVAATWGQVKSAYRQ